MICCRSQSSWISMITYFIDFLFFHAFVVFLFQGCFIITLDSSISNFDLPPQLIIWGEIHLDFKIHFSIKYLSFIKGEKYLLSSLFNSQETKLGNLKFIKILEFFGQNLAFKCIGILTFLHLFESKRKYYPNSLPDLILIKSPRKLRKYIWYTQLTFVKS